MGDPCPPSQPYLELSPLRRTLPSSPVPAQELKKAAEHDAGAAYGLTWYGRLSTFVDGGGAPREQAPRLLAVMKDALVGGPETPQWSAAKVRGWGCVPLGRV